MLNNLMLKILVQVLVLLGSAPTCVASSLGLSVHVVPLESEAGRKVRAHFTAIAPQPCPPLTGLCAESEDCEVHKTSTPFTGSKPDSGWCVRQWEKTVSSQYSGTISLGSSTGVFVKIKADPHIRANNRRLNQPPFVALFPPLRVHENCPSYFPLTVKDLDGDKVKCRFAQADQGECLNCAPHLFIQLDEEKCVLTFNGQAPAGQYFIYLMAEDRIPIPKQRVQVPQDPLSSVPVHLSLTVEKTSSGCQAVPEATGRTPKKHSTFYVLPYEDVQFKVHFSSQQEKIEEFAVVGPLTLSRTGFNSEASEASMTMSWVRADNTLPRLLSVCFAANTKSLQSPPICVWLHQRELRVLPPGTELTCNNMEMKLVLPIATLSNINLEELQLNSPDCPIENDGTYLTARISLVGCGTKTVASGTELIYTNTLQSVRPWTIVSRKPSFILPLACRIPGVQASGPWSSSLLPTEEETFGKLTFWMEVHLPGEGPFAPFTRTPVFRTVPRFGRAHRGLVFKGNDTDNTTISQLSIGSKLNYLDLTILCNTSFESAEMVVDDCMQSLSEDMSQSTPILQNGCVSETEAAEIETTVSYSKVYRMDLSDLPSTNKRMYVECLVSLCIATLPSLKCPDRCTRERSNSNILSSLFTKTYTIKSGPVSLFVTTPAPKVATVAGTKTTQSAPAVAGATPSTAQKTTTTSSAEERSSVTILGIILPIVCIQLQWIFFP
ncbi:uncharacterized protein LOC128759514 [Synchiropus splendidus]|uniref:uncharacterized protein LOC128759514 n=1 Tax=Synchiropus splendidus TaxID=270530 RepID=UPI00237DB96B|nr:uncharacterized protein LOC128759514 [Synchiropus splendidus]